MKTIGIIGGMTWQSSAIYYKQLNEKAHEVLSDSSSARCILSSLDFSDIKPLQEAGNWKTAEKILLSEAKKLKDYGAELLLISSTTMHKVADCIEERIDIDFLHIADVIAEDTTKFGLKRVALLGTKFTMNDSFFKERLTRKSGVQVQIPNLEERDLIHNVIYDELSNGIIRDSSREKYLSIIERMSRQGCEAVILGCTEIGMLLSKEHTSIRVLDTTSLHTSKAIELAVL
jgi:amino-acid racemase